MLLRAAVADRRVLHLLRAGRAADPSDADDPDPTSPPARSRRRSRTTSSRTRCASRSRSASQLLINEFGTALAGNPTSLNEAIRLGAPALTPAAQGHRRSSPRQNTDHPRPQRELRPGDRQARRPPRGRRPLHPEGPRHRRGLGRPPRRPLARLRAPRRLPRRAAADPGQARRRSRASRRRCCADLRAAAPRAQPPGAQPAGLQRRDRGLARQPRRRLDRRQHGAAPRRATRSSQLAESGKKAPQTAEMLADFLRDIDDPRRAVEIDDRVPTDTGRTEPAPGRSDTKGYTGLEGLLNYAYYQAGRAEPVRPGRPPAALQPLRHLHRARAATSRAAATRRPASPASRPRAAARRPTSSTPTDCVGWLGPNQPGHQRGPRTCRKYDPSVCPNGHQPAGRRADALQPRVAGDAQARSRRPRRPRRAAARAPTPAARARPRRRRPAPAAATAAAAPATAGARRLGGPMPDDILDQILDLPPEALDDLPPELQDQLGGGAGQRQPAAAGAGGPAAAARADDLLDFLFQLIGRASDRRRPPMRSRGSLDDHRLADDGRRGHDADRDRRRLPRLQREHGPAVRARLPRLGRDPRRRAADQQQRGPDRRPPGRRRRVDRRGRSRTRRRRPPRRAARTRRDGDDRRRRSRGST